MAKRESAAPVKVFRIGNDSASVFARTIPGKNGAPDRDVHCVHLQKSYLDDKGERRYTHSFDLYELPNAQRVLTLATDYVANCAYLVEQLGNGFAIINGS
jgi:hypothetical protein